MYKYVNTTFWVYLLCLCVYDFRNDLKLAFGNQFCRGAGGSPLVETSFSIPKQFLVTQTDFFDCNFLCTKEIFGKYLKVM